MSLERGEKEILKQALKSLGPVDRELALEYARALDAIRSQISTVFDKYAVDGVVTYADMTKYNRLANLDKSIRKQLVGLGVKTKSIITKQAKDRYEDAFFRFNYNIENELRIPISFGDVNPAFIKAQIEQPWSGFTLSETLQDLTAQQLKGVKRAITQGLIQGESLVKIRNRLKTVMQTNSKRAMTIARTEALRAMSQGHLEGIKRAEDKGIKVQKVWVAVLDGRTREQHLEMDGVLAEGTGHEAEFVLPDGATGQGPHLTGEPQHDINCRCDMRVDQLDLPKDIEQTIEKRRVEGKLLDQKGYEAWKKERLSVLRKPKKAA